MMLYLQVTKLLVGLFVCGFFHIARNRLILALSISWLSCATYVVVTSDFFQASRKGKAQKHVAEVRLNNEPTLSLITQLMGHISCVVSTVPVCNDNQQRYTLIVVTIKVPAGHCNCLAHGEWKRWMMALSCLSGFRSFGRDFHNLRKLMLSTVILV